MNASANAVEVAVHTRLGVHRWIAPTTASLAFDGTPGSPWLLVPPTVRAAFDTLAQLGTPIAESEFGPPVMGVKCGCNEAFLVALDDEQSRVVDEDLVGIRMVRVGKHRGPARRGFIERPLLRPVVRGETLGRWICAGRRPITDDDPHGRRRAGRPAANGCAEWIIWTHEGESGGAAGPRAELPPHAAKWLGHWRHRLAARSDTHGHMPWWTLFRTVSATPSGPRVVWPDLGRAPRAALLPAGDLTVPLNTCYVQRSRDLIDAQALTTLLNSSIAAAWLNVLAEPARGGYRRYMGWTVGLLPLPFPWERARDVLAPLAVQAMRGTPPSQARLTDVVAAAYGVDLDLLAPLMAWSGA